MNIEKRQSIERTIVRKVIELALSRGYTISVYDGESYPVWRSDDFSEIFGAMFLTDEETIRIYDDNHRLGSIFFVYGNDGYDVIADHSCSLESFLAPITEYTDKLMDKYS